MVISFFVSGVMYAFVEEIAEMNTLSHPRIFFANEYTSCPK